MQSNLEAALDQQIKLVQLDRPEREYQFDADRRYRFDFAWPDVKVACEVEGGTFIQGRHVRGKGFEGDCEKYNLAACLGWRVIRVTSKMIHDGRALKWIERVMND